MPRWPASWRRVSVDRCDRCLHGLGLVVSASACADAQQADRLLQNCGDLPWWVPGLCQLKVANTLLVAECRSVLPRADSLPSLTDTDPH